MTLLLNKTEPFSFVLNFQLMPIIKEISYLQFLCKNEIIWLRTHIHSE